MYQITTYDKNQRQLAGLSLAEAFSLLKLYRVAGVPATVRTGSGIPRLPRKVADTESFDRRKEPVQACRIPA